MILKKPQEIYQTVDKESAIISRAIEQEDLESNFKQESEESISDSDLQDDSLAFLIFRRQKK